MPVVPEKRVSVATNERPDRDVVEPPAAVPVAPPVRDASEAEAPKVGCPEGEAQADAAPSASREIPSRPTAHLVSAPAGRCLVAWLDFAVLPAAWESPDHAIPPAILPEKAASGRTDPPRARRAQARRDRCPRGLKSLGRALAVLAEAKELVRALAPLVKVWPEPRPDAPAWARRSARDWR
jgi:hypothetical protein